MKTLTQKLDLDQHINNFKNFYARDKEIEMQGDINQHHRYIQALSKVEFPSIKEVPNLDREINILKKQGILRLEELYAFVTMLSYFNSLKALSLPEPLNKWIQEISIDDEINDIILYFTDEGNINPERDSGLYEIEKALKINKSELKEKLYKMAHSSTLKEYLVDTQVHFLNGEETLMVRGGFNKVVKASVVGRSSTGFFYILPQSISHLKEKEAMLLSKKEEVVYRYCQSFSTTFSKWHLFMRFINREYDRFDHYQARVLFAKTYDFSFILPSKSKVVKLSEFCHPAIEKPKPVNIDLDKSVMLVTGVNAGGKTMLLKSLLSAVYMAKNLLPFRCNEEKTQVGHFKSIEAVIDDPQSVKNDISTFAGRMVEFAKLFDKENAIVGVDEIELGTDSDEAASLFRVMLDELKKKGITFIVTTHHKRLASLMSTDKDVELIAALYDEANRKPTYTFLQGSIGKSYAFETAQRYGVPEHIVKKAKEVYGEDKENLNELIEKSTTLEREMRLKLERIDKELKIVESKKENLENIEAKLNEEQRKAVATFENRYNAATKRALEAMKVKESTEGRRLLNDAHKHKKLSKHAKSIEQPNKRVLQIGDSVKYRTSRGEILGIRNKEATIEVDGLKMRVPLSQLRYLESVQKKVIQKPKTTVKVEKSGRGSISIKLLGCYADEAIDKLDVFLSDALVSGFNEVEVIHGTGGGVLKKVIIDYLKSYPKLQSFHGLKGNLGITVVKL
ncbi:MAG: Recombination inhibitory protein MutS2 [uncultured Sulfurovum sp.]|uniref:Endonuclease MutS2 n=1 Tax=uncultured Sulfurovum sp. TaxID=269237 RepID=A0A6S6TYJ2_9BACT|nr:MAG: Recombination inhibitory protein MutS2 [uncultured Sulfurovum sp.]